MYIGRDSALEECNLLVFVYLTGPLQRSLHPVSFSLWLLPLVFKTNTKQKCRSNVSTRLCIGHQSPESVDKSQSRTNWDHTWIIEDIKSDHDPLWKRGKKRVRVALTSEPDGGEQKNPGKIPWIMGCSDGIFSPADALSWILRRNLLIMAELKWSLAPSISQYQCKQ